MQFWRGDSNPVNEVIILQTQECFIYISWIIFSITEWTKLFSEENENEPRSLSSTYGTFKLFHSDKSIFVLVSSKTPSAPHPVSSDKIKSKNKTWQERKVQAALWPPYICLSSSHNSQPSPRLSPSRLAPVPRVHSALAPIRNFTDPCWQRSCRLLKTDPSPLLFCEHLCG